jgi:hypothetical protein
LKRVRQLKQTYGMKAHVVEHVDEPLHILVGFSVNGEHGRGVRCSTFGSAVAVIV